ncbi:Putative AMP-dependent synthetase/ligase, AMP-binding, ANL domain-containing protein [Septoria linicola]|uniref:AMP-dependent synthetase/ligase, AMP-binding, ANL domain-containing protein n=1 Tax=Septoria linicola TaxID=215465 RepID=A0A9Q9AYL3_9PEZI|nr:Putative AMP-dependent synthetase/ligase, AMP-binding, ANL domain-containing protein [Septoria linicola]
MSALIPLFKSDKSSEWHDVDHDHREKIEALAQDPVARIFSSLVLKDDSVQDITYSHFLNIIDQAATWLDANLPQPSSASDFPTFQYVGDLNLRRLALVVAGAKTGRKILMTRRYALPDVVAHLIDETNCNVFLYEPSGRDAMNPQFGDETAIRLTLPAWDSWFSASTITTYTPRPPRQRNMDDPVCVFHTSGTTGNPKSICLRYSRCVVAAI